MYKSEDGGQEMGRAEKCKPDYEEMAARLKKKIDTFVTLRNSLFAFVDVVGTRSLKREPSSISEFLGTLEIDIRKFSKEWETILTQLEKEK